MARNPTQRKRTYAERRAASAPAREKRKQKRLIARLAAGLPPPQRGQPKKMLLPELEKVLYRCAARGFTQDQIANLLAISEETLQARLKETPRLQALIKQAKADTINLATGKLHEAIRAGKAWAICFYLKCRAGWHEKLEVGGEVKHTIEEQFATAVQSAPAFVRDVVKQLPPGELRKLQQQYATAGVPEDGGRTQ